MRAIIAAGGTAGHINPGIAIAEEIMKNQPGSEVLFIGREDGMEKELVAMAGYRLVEVEVHGFMRKITFENIVSNINALYHVFAAQRKVKKIIEDFKPDVVIGCGGYVSGPAVLKAAKMGIPTAIQEQNAFPGMTTKLLAKHVDLIMVASEDAIRNIGFREKCVVTGNPVRLEFFSADRAKLRKMWGVGDRTCVVSFGGSLGADTINGLAAAFMAKHAATGEVYHIHATGQFGTDFVPEMLSIYGIDITKSDNISIVEYIENMPDCLAAADMVLSRSGAITISEIAAAGRASVLVPSPNVTENHQYYNARILADADAALIYEEKNLDFDKAAGDIFALARDKQKLKLMGINARSKAVASSTKRIYDAVVDIIAKN